MTDETKDGVILGIGASVSALLVKLAGNWMNRARKEPVALSEQNIEWAKDMMSRLEKQVDALNQRVSALENELQEEREGRLDCEERYRELLGRKKELHDK